MRSKTTLLFAFLVFLLGCDLAPTSHQHKQTGRSPTPSKSDSIHLAPGAPSSSDPNLEDFRITRTQYALSYNHHRNGANWVSWELNAGYLGGQARHKGHFITDETLPKDWYRVRHDDYSNSDYDRGHMVRSEDRTRSAEDNDSTFILTNVLPQRHDLNAGPWLRLEDFCRKLAVTDHRELFIVAGGIYNSKPKTIGHDLAVPDAFFKVVLVLPERPKDPDWRPDFNAPGIRVLAVLIPNTSGIMDHPWKKYKTTVAEVQRNSGFKFFTNVSETNREKFLTQVDAE